MKNEKVISVDFQRLQEAKKAKKLSSYKIAEAGDLKPDTVQKIVKGLSNPTAVNLKKICDVLEIPFEEIFVVRAAA